MNNKPAKSFVACKGLIINDGQLLLLKKVGTNVFWDLPGGRLSKGESFYRGLKRELQEELPDIKINNIGNLLGVYKRYINNKQEELLLLYFQVEASFPQGIKLSDEHDDYHWVKLAKLDKLQLPVNPFFHDMMEKLRQQPHYGVIAYAK